MKPARREILEKLRNTKISVPEKPDFDEPVFHAPNFPPIETFKNSLEEVNGHVHVFQNIIELRSALKNDLKKYESSSIYCMEHEIQQILCSVEIPFSTYKNVSENIEAGITGCEFLVAQTGSVLVSSAQKGGRQLFIYPPVHYVIASKTQLVNTLDDAFLSISKKYSNIMPSQLLLITGPSRTADIEKTLTLGAHGPKELHIYLH